MKKGNLGLVGGKLVDDGNVSHSPVDALIEPEDTDLLLAGAMLHMISRVARSRRAMMSRMSRLFLKGNVEKEGESTGRHNHPEIETMVGPACASAT